MKQSQYLFNATLRECEEWGNTPLPFDSSQYDTNHNESLWKRATGTTLTAESISKLHWEDIEKMASLVMQQIKQVIANSDRNPSISDRYVSEMKRLRNNLSILIN